MTQAFRGLKKEYTDAPLITNFEMASGDNLTRPRPELPPRLEPGRHKVTVFHGLKTDVILFQDILEIPEELPAPEPEPEPEEPEEYLEPDVELAGKMNTVLLKDRESFYLKMVEIQGQFYERLQALEGEHRDRTERLYQQNQKNLEAQIQRLLDIVAEKQAAETEGPEMSGALEEAAKVLIQKFMGGGQPDE